MARRKLKNRTEARYSTSMRGGVVGGSKEKEESKRRDPSENPRSDLARERASRKRALVSDSGAAEGGLSV